MSWSQLHERMALMNTLIDEAATNPDAGLQPLIERAAEIQRLFGDEEGLLLSLRHRWLTMLAAKLDQAAHEDLPAEQVRVQLVAAHPGLRALLDAAARRSVRLRALEHGERHIVDLYARPEDGRRTVA
jgi:hypothetical protein